MSKLNEWSKTEGTERFLLKLEERIGIERKSFESKFRNGNNDALWQLCIIQGKIAGLESVLQMIRELEKD